MTPYWNFNSPASTGETLQLFESTYFRKTDLLFEKQFDMSGNKISSVQVGAIEFQYMLQKTEF